MTKVVIFNGNNPRSGKGTCAKILSGWAEEQGYSYQTPEFKDKLIELTATTLGITVEEFLYGYDSTASDFVQDNKELFPVETLIHACTKGWWKDVCIYGLGNKCVSKREALIHVSENIIKPNFGEDYFGKALVESISPMVDFAFVADGGFVQEVEAVVHAVGLGNVLVVNLYRDVDNPAKDSRKLLNGEDFHWALEPEFVKVENNSTIDDLRKQLIENITPWLEKV